MNGSHIVDIAALDLTLGLLALARFFRGGRATFLPLSLRFTLA